METNNTTLSYRGDVKLKLIVGNKIIEVDRHNSGTLDLMKSICKYLTGNGVPQYETPQFLDLRRQSTSGDTDWDTYLTRQISVGTSGRSYEYDSTLSNWVAKFSFSLPYSALVDYIEADDTAYNYRLYLYAEDESGSIVDLAYLPITAQELSNITPGIQAIVEWQLQIKNADNN